MPTIEALRVFISYVRKDGAALAHRLQSDPTKGGFDTWLTSFRSLTHIEGLQQHLEQFVAPICGALSTAASHFAHMLGVP
jgi:hypothetical protein